MIPASPADLELTVKPSLPQLAVTLSAGLPSVECVGTPHLALPLFKK